jgi:hypothetical protein
MLRDPVLRAAHAALKNSAARAADDLRIDIAAAAVK